MKPNWINFFTVISTSHLRYFKICSSLSHFNFSPPLRYCVLLITGDEETFSFGNQAFLSFASTNTKEVVRFAYVYQRLQQPLCDTLMQNKDSSQSPPQVHSYMSNAAAASFTVNLRYDRGFENWYIGYGMYEMNSFVLMIRRIMY